MIRKLFFTAAAIMAALIFCACAYADAALYIGSRNAGAVKTLENNSGLFVPVEDVGRLLGFSSSRKGEELSLQRDNVQLRVVDNSAAAWYGFSIVPLYSAPFKQDGKTWLDSSSAAALFQRVVGSGQNNRLRISKISGYTVTTANARNDIEFGNFEIPTQTPAPSQTVAKKTQEPVINLPEVKTPTKTPEPQIQTVQTAAATQNKTSASKAKAQPKLETFKLGESKGDKSESYSGVIQGIRWTSHEGTQKKIRAVILVDDDAEPTVFMNRRQLHALFSSSLETSEQLASPFGNVKTEIKKNSRGVDLIFDFEKLSKAEKIVLTNPKRIVFDFFLPSNVTITQSVSAKDKVQQATQPKPVIPTVPQTPAPVATQKKEEKEQPAKTLILIPTTPTPTTPSRNNIKISSGKKTIVVDPGHGGKDPGASANGVVEKNVNLGIGLELEKALKARGYNVIMTRRTDVYLKLQERTDIANNANADLFVSVHVNALPSKKDMTGFEIYIMALPTDKDAMNLAKIENREYVEGKGFDTENVDRRTEMLLRILGDMQQNNKISESTDFAAALYNAGVRNSLPMRRVAQAPFFVLRGAGMPAVLLETGFVTNAAESQKLTTQAYQQRIAQAMAEGIVNYIR